MRTTNLRGTLSALRRVVLGLAALCVANCPAADLNARVAAAGEGLRGPDSWGMIPRHPAVVNAVTDEPSADRISLCGEWDFFAPKRYDNYRTACWENMHLLSDEKRALRGKKGQAFVRKMNVPGCWEGQGFGEEGEGRGWAVVSDRSQPVMRHVWFGQAWYRRYVDIPKSWAGKRIWLKTGGAMSQGWFWVNDRQVAWWDFYCGTYKYEITDFVKPGERAKIDVMASNLPPCRRGNFVSGNHWGGITRAVELEATPATLIDDAWARGDFDARAAEVHVTVTGPGAEGAAVRVTVAGATAEAPAAADGAETVLRVPLKNFRAWSPEHPHLYVAAIELLEGGRVTMTRRERFGVRKLEVCGKEFRLNGKPFYFRGAGYHNIDPIHGMRPPDRAFYLDELRHVKAAGFNALRTHTRCETPEFFEACDELGLFVQPELPYYTDSPTDDFRFDPVGDVLELYANYRRHPSFAVYSGGNEGSFGPDLSRRIHALVKSLDPDRLAIDQDRWGELPTDRTDYQMNFMAPWPRGSYDPAQPFLAHEYLNLAVKIDARTEPKYTGVKPPPVTVKGRTEWLAKFGLSWDFGVKLQEAQHRLQAYWQKDGFESARNDPYCDGFYYWSLQDVAGIQGTARTAQALFDPFWGEKPCGWTAREFAAFNSPVCVLADVEGRRPTERVFTSGEKAVLVFRVSQYGEEPVKGAALAWRLAASDGRTLAEGRAAPGDIACGPVREVARAEVTFPDVPSAAKAVLEVRLTDAAGRLAAPVNSWNFWVFPKRAPRDGSRIAAADEWRAALAKGYPGVRPLSEMDRADVVIARHFDQETVAKARAAGKHLITVEKVKGPSANRLGWWSITSQAGAVYAHRPEFRHFPHEGFHDALAFRLLKQAETKLPFEDLSEKDLLVAGEGGEACYFYFGEKPRADGRKWYVAFGFDLLADYPEARAVLDGVLEQCDSAAGCGAAEWESPRTTRRYLNPPLAERMAVLWSDAKISLADVLHEKDWHKREYTNELANACWFLRGPDARPFDFRTARNLISSDGVPSHGLEWTEDGVTVRLETVCDYVRKPTVFGRFAVQNGGKAPAVREYAVRVRHGNEAQLFGGLKNGPPDFYCAYASHPESWDAVPCDWSLGDGALQAASGGFMTFSQLPAGARWDAALGAVRFTLSLAAGETFAIDFAFGYGPRRDPAYDRTLAQANGRWRAELDRISRLPKSIRSNPARRRLVRHLTAQILQCLSLPVGRDYVLPRQGCLERGVWPWDCQEAMEALILIGDFNEYVEGALAFFFDLYATGERYRGEENRGRIGPFLFDWDCNTANVIGMLGRYCAATGNRTLWERYRVRALDGFRWVLAHRVKPESANGMIPGVFPPGRATDSNPSKRHRHVQPWEWTDVLNLDGIEHLLAAAEKFDDPAKGEVRAGYEDYLATVRKLMAEKLSANANGAEYRLQSYLDNNGRTMYKPNKTGYWLNWAVRHGLCSEQEVVRAWRECLAGGVVSDKGLCYIFPARDNRHYWYTTSMEKHWHHLLRQAGQDELADKVLNGVLRYAMTQDLCVGERYCDNDPWYLPWSPNASGSGRIIQMLLEAK